jgi:hypothetical protein
MAGIKNSRAVIQERRNKIWVMLTKGSCRGIDIARDLKVDPATVSRDITYLTSQSQSYLNNLAKETLPFFYMQNMDGIKQVLKECWNIYESTDKSINYFQRLAALKLAKECNEAQFKLLSEGPSILYVQTLEDKLSQIEAMQQQPQALNQISR